MTGLRDSELNDVVSAFNLMRYYKKRGVHAVDEIVLDAETFVRTFEPYEKSKEKVQILTSCKEYNLFTKYRDIPFTAYATDVELTEITDALAAEKEE